MVSFSLRDPLRRLLRKGQHGSSAEAALLYGLTFAGELLLGAPARWVLVHLLVQALGTVVSLGPAGELLPWFAAISPLAKSLLTLIGWRGWVNWDRVPRIRRPTAQEEDAFLLAMVEIWLVEPEVQEPDPWYVLDAPVHGAAVSWGSLILSKATLGSAALPAIVGHELGHLNSGDARLKTSIRRLAPWPDPLGSAFDEEDRRSRLLRISICPLRWALRLAGGGYVRARLRALWSPYWKAREYAADSYAASLGQGENLRRYLAAIEARPDAGFHRLLTALSDHPPTAERVDRLGAQLALAGLEPESGPGESRPPSDEQLLRSQQSQARIAVGLAFLVTAVLAAWVPSTHHPQVAAGIVMQTLAGLLVAAELWANRASDAFVKWAAAQVAANRWRIAGLFDGRLRSLAIACAAYVLVTVAVTNAWALAPSGSGKWLLAIPLWLVFAAALLVWILAVSALLGRVYAGRLRAADGRALSDFRARLNDISWISPLAGFCFVVGGVLQISAA